LIGLLILLDILEDKGTYSYSFFRGNSKGKKIRTVSKWKNSKKHDQNHQERFVIL
jgi:hypothetical protein